MGILIFDEEMSSKVAPGRMFKGLVTDSHNLGPIIVPQYIKGGAIVEGEGGAGTIKEVYFAEGVPVPYVKFKIDELDEAKFTYKYTLMEGGELNETIQSITIEMKFESTADGGCINKIKKLITVAEGAKLNPEELKAYKVKARMLFDRVESYLLENPDIYA